MNIVTNKYDNILDRIKYKLDLIIKTIRPKVRVFGIMKLNNEHNEYKMYFSKEKNISHIIENIQSRYKHAEIFIEVSPNTRSHMIIKDIKEQLVGKKLLLSYDIITLTEDTSEKDFRRIIENIIYNVDCD